MSSHYANRDKAAKLLPVEVLREILPDGGFARLAAASYRTPSNEAEAQVHRELLDLGVLPLNKGWPDFLAVDGDGIFVVEVKQGADFVRPEQRVVLEMLARIGIDAYVATRAPRDKTFVYEAVGDSKHWTERAQEKE